MGLRVGISVACPLHIAKFFHADIVVAFQVRGKKRVNVGGSSIMKTISPFPYQVFDIEGKVDYLVLAL